jgi:hypothetical protein
MNKRYRGQRDRKPSQGQETVPFYLYQQEEIVLGGKFKTVTTKKEYTIEEFYNTIKDHSFSAGAPALTKHGLSTIIAFPPLDRHNQVWIMPYLTFKKTSTSKFQVSKNDVAGMGNAAVNIALSDLTGGLTNFRGMLGRYAKAAEKLVDMTAGELNEMQL